MADKQRTNLAKQPEQTKSLSWLCRLGFHKWSYDHMPAEVPAFTLPYFVCGRCGKMKQRI